MAADVQYQGYLARFQDDETLGQSLWRREFCTLSGELLQCFREPTDPVPVLEVLLTPRCTCDKLEWQAHALRIAAPTLALCLAAENDTSCSCWYDRVQRAIARATARGNAGRRMHQFSIAGSIFDIDYRYEPTKPIGSGAYGLVIAAHDRELGEKVAIKKVPRTFDELVGAKRVLREIKLLMHFDHENIITIQDILPPRSMSDFVDVYIVTDLMETDLHRVIYSKQKLGDEHVQYFLYQILCALKYIHSAGVMHRDLKPSNILLNANCDLKICDFGLARGVLPPPSAHHDKVHASSATGAAAADADLAAREQHEDDERERQQQQQPKQSDLTEYVVTRWYRAPEIMLSCLQYSCAIDVWSVGCIFAEMLGRRPLFPGRDYINQLKIIVEGLGTPTEADLHSITNDKARRFMLSLAGHAKIPFSVRFPKADPKAIDLLDRMLQFDADRRISVEDALEHPYMASLHAVEDEPVADASFRFDFEDEELDKHALQRLVLDEVAQFHPGWAATAEAEVEAQMEAQPGVSFLDSNSDRETFSPLATGAVELVSSETPAQPQVHHESTPTPTPATAQTPPISIAADAPLPPSQ